MLSCDCEVLILMALHVIDWKFLYDIFFPERHWCVGLLRNNTKRLECVVCDVLYTYTAKGIRYTAIFKL